MLPLTGRSENTRFTAFFKLATYVLTAFYFVNCLTHLQLHYDTLRYYAIKDCWEYGCPPDSDSAHDYLPYGYTGLLLLLSKLHILRSFSIVFINALYLLGGLYFTRKMFGTAIRPFVFFVVVMLNWAVIKFYAYPLSELQYLFFSIGSLYFYFQYTKNKRPLPLVLAFVFAGLAFLTRTIGIALVPALLLSLIWEYRKELTRIVRNNKILVVIAGLVVIGVVVFSKQLGLDHYTGVMSKQKQGGVNFAQILEWRFKEWAELFFNVPSNKVLNYLPAKAGTEFFVLAGILFFAWFVYLFISRKTSIPVIVRIYLLFYGVIMFSWPFYDPRFWVPVIPLLSAILLQTPVDKSKAIKGFGSLYLGVYMLLGVAALSFATYLCFNKKEFARHHANGVYRNEYETHFFGKPLSDTATQVNPFDLHVLDRYD